MKGVMQMVFHKLVTAKIRLFFGSLRARKAKRRLLREFKKNPQSVSALSRAYERFLRAIRKEQEYTVALKAVRAEFSRRPILPLTLDTGNYTVSRKAKEILSETDIVCALERHKHCDWGHISSDDWVRCNVCAQMGYGYTYSRHKTSDGRYFCILTDCKKPKTKIVTEEELNAGRDNTGASYKEPESSSLKKAG